MIKPMFSIIRTSSIFRPNIIRRRISSQDVDLEKMKGILAHVHRDKLSLRQLRYLDNYCEHTVDRTYNFAESERILKKIREERPKKIRPEQRRTLSHIKELLERFYSPDASSMCDSWELRDANKLREKLRISIQAFQIISEKKPPFSIVDTEILEINERYCTEHEIAEYLGDVCKCQHAIETMFKYKTDGKQLLELVRQLRDLHLD